ncbi:NAD(P)H-binding protein [Nonomuraea sp. NPDC050643]|uniref:NAD(P)H-binding protein n=1 Tax=Nonomuraea sp. NPDC050643 TaxID=3155660 RepID=UPI00340F2C21
MAAEPIVVVGASGKTGRRVVARLRRQGREVRAASRRGEVRFDWADPGTWSQAVRGAGAAYLVDSQGGDAPAQLRAFGETASALGVRRLVLLSSRDWSTSGGEAALASERALQEAGTTWGMEWTILRPTWFAQNFSEDALLRDPVLSGEVRLPTGDGLEPFVDADDIADVAAAVLTRDGHAGRIYELSGPRLLSFGAAVGEIGRASGRELAYVPVSAEEYTAHLSGRGFDRDDAELITTLFGWIRAGRNERLSDGVQRVLGREPRDFSGYVTATAATGAWTV